MSDVEKDVVLELNKVRANPKRFAEMYVKPRFSLFDGSYNGRGFRKPGESVITVSKEGRAAVSDCVAALTTQCASVGILEPAEGLFLGARDHCRDLGPWGVSAHEGTDGSKPRDRMKRYGSVSGESGEDIGFGSETGREIVISLLVDDGVPSRGHRANIMDPAYRVVGVALGPHKTIRTMCTIDFAHQYETTAVAAVVEEWDLSVVDTARKAEYMSDLEKDIVREVNKVRVNGPEYGEQYIRPRAGYFERLVYHEPGASWEQTTKEGAAAVKECVRELGESPRLVVLLPTQGLCQAARDHCRDMGTKGLTGHNGSDGCTPADRMGRHGKWSGSVAESLAFGRTDAVNIVVGMLIDDGVPSRGHRRNIMKEAIRFIGAPCGPHRQLRNMCTMDFAEGWRDEGATDPRGPAQGAGREVEAEDAARNAGEDN
jgi:uncharacterized protein YkwD